ncbi:MAG: hypothetical protein JNL18_14580 [Planctomycetaceae bacterium]|nr:hypothetical protein [Planctomycetaceae bacterium]
MSSYHYVVFPRGKQPTADEVREFQKFAGALANQFAWGTCRDDGRLALAVDRQSCDHVQQIDPGFAAVIRRWESHGCELLPHLAFVKDAAALKPTPSSAWLSQDGRGTVQSRRAESALAVKELAAKEAIGRSMLAVQHSLDRYAVIQRVAAALPYALMALAAVLTIGAGWYIRDRLLHSGRERRQETIERALSDPPPESLASDAPPDR